MQGNLLYPKFYHGYQAKSTGISLVFYHGYPDFTFAYASEHQFKIIPHSTYNRSGRQ